MIGLASGELMGLGFLGRLACKANAEISEQIFVFAASDKQRNFLYWDPSVGMIFFIFFFLGLILASILNYSFPVWRSNGL